MYILAYACRCIILIYIHVHVHVLIIADIFTVEEAIEKMGFGPFQILITVFSGMLWVRVITRMRAINGTPCVV